MGDGSELTSGSLDWIVEARADEETLSIAVDRLCVGGTLILKSRPSGPVPFDVSLAVKRSLTIRAVHYGSFDRAIELLSTSLDVDFIFGALHQLDEFEAVFANADHETRKVFFEIGAW